MPLNDNAFLSKSGPNRLTQELVADHDVSQLIETTSNMNIAWRITYSFDNLFTFSITSTAGSKIVAARTLKPTNSRVARYHYACTPLLITSPWKCN